MNDPYILFGVDPDTGAPLRWVRIAGGVGQTFWSFMRWERGDMAISVVCNTVEPASYAAVLAAKRCLIEGEPRATPGEALAQLKRAGRILWRKRDVA